MPSYSLHHPTKNRLLAALPAIELDDLIPNLELVHMPLGDTLCKAGEQLPYAYFPTSAIISIHHILENGASSEIASVGREGMLGIALFMGGEDTRSWATVSIAGYGYRIKPAFLLQEFNRRGLLQRLLLRYSQALITEATQNVACSRHHQVEQRLCCWLLSTQNRIDSQELILTQELMASILGVRRESVTHAARKLQEAGMIRYRRGHVRVIDGAGLQKGACECYDKIKKEFDLVFEDVRKSEESL